jgi:hypothetical protein
MYLLRNSRSRSGAPVHATLQGSSPLPDRRSAAAAAL